jgi:hypothetical protein
MVASPMVNPMVNNQNYQKEGEATMKEKTNTLTKRPMEEILKTFWKSL